VRQIRGKHGTRSTSIHWPRQLYGDRRLDALASDGAEAAAAATAAATAAEQQGHAALRRCQVQKSGETYADERLQQLVAAAGGRVIRRMAINGFIVMFSVFTSTVFRAV
jgi:hypothetical protein